MVRFDAPLYAGQTIVFTAVVAPIQQYVSQPLPDNGVRSSLVEVAASWSSAIDPGLYLGKVMDRVHLPPPAFAFVRDTTVTTKFTLDHPFSVQGMITGGSCSTVYLNSHCVALVVTAPAQPLYLNPQYGGSYFQSLFTLTGDTPSVSTTGYSRSIIANFTMPRSWGPTAVAAPVATLLWSEGECSRSTMPDLTRMMPLWSSAVPYPCSGPCPKGYYTTAECAVGVDRVCAACAADCASGKCTGPRSSDCVVPPAYVVSATYDFGVAAVGGVVSVPCSYNVMTYPYLYNVTLTVPAGDYGVTWVHVDVDPPGEVKLSLLDATAKWTGPAGVWKTYYQQNQFQLYPFSVTDVSTMTFTGTMQLPCGELPIAQRRYNVTARWLTTSGVWSTCGRVRHDAVLLLRALVLQSSVVVTTDGTDD